MDPIQTKSLLLKAWQWLKDKFVIAKKPGIRIQASVIYSPGYPNTLLEGMQAKHSCIQSELQNYSKGSFPGNLSNFRKFLLVPSSKQQRSTVGEVARCISEVFWIEIVQGEQGNRAEF